MGHEAIAYAQEMGVDVVVTDHHSMQETLPNAYTIVHPEHPEGNYPSNIWGCGVALQIGLCSSLKLFMQTCWIWSPIGTIADMVSMTDENRVMVKYVSRFSDEDQTYGPSRIDENSWH